MCKGKFDKRGFKIRIQIRFLRNLDMASRICLRGKSFHPFTRLKASPWSSYFNIFVKFTSLHTLKSPSTSTILTKTSTRLISTRFTPNFWQKIGPSTRLNENRLYNIGSIFNMPPTPLLYLKCPLHTNV